MIELIPAIDIIDGKCVRLTQGDYATKKVYNEDPLEVAKMFEGNGIRRLHVVDLDGAREGRIINYRILERIATRTSLIIDFGGGLKQEDDLEIAFESGAQMVTGGSIAVKNPEMFTSWIRKEDRHQRLGGNDQPRVGSFYQRILRQGDYQGDLHGYRTGWYAARPGYRFI